MVLGKTHLTCPDFIEDQINHARSIFPTCRNQSVDLQGESVGWFLYDDNFLASNGLMIKTTTLVTFTLNFKQYFHNKGNRVVSVVVLVSLSLTLKTCITRSMFICLFSATTCWVYNALNKSARTSSTG